MSYIVIKTINGRQYRYRQTSYRIGKKVKTKSVYLGPVGGGLRSIGNIIEANRIRGPQFDEQAVLRDVLTAEAKYSAMKERFHKEIGLRVGLSNPAPVERVTRDVLAAVPASSFANSPSTDAGEASEASAEAGAANP